MAVDNFLTLSLTRSLTFVLNLRVVLAITFDSVVRSVDECKFTGKLNFLFIVEGRLAVFMIVGASLGVSVNFTSGLQIVVVVDAVGVVIMLNLLLNMSWKK